MFQKALDHQRRPAGKPRASEPLFPILEKSVVQNPGTVKDQRSEVFLGDFEGEEEEGERAFHVFEVRVEQRAILGEEIVELRRGKAVPLEELGDGDLLPVLGLVRRRRSWLGAGWDGRERSAIWAG